MVGLQTAGRRPPPSPQRLTAGSPAWADSIADRFLEALLAGDRELALRLADRAVEMGHAVADVHVHVLQQAMVRIGQLWETGRISVAAEHTATAIVQFVVTALYPRMQRSDAVRGQAVVAGVAGESHQLGAHLVSDALEADGWQVRFLGADCPQGTILGVCLQARPALLALSCTMTGNLPRLAQLIAALRRQPAGAPLPRILVGGQAFGSGPQARQRALQLGADELALDLHGAVAAARLLTPPPAPRAMTIAGC